jgi:hypothetical protein
MLQRDLPGYADYAARVPYRLVPGMWCDVAPRVVSRQDLILEPKVAEHVWFMVVRSAALKKPTCGPLTTLQHFRRSQCSHDLR